MRLNLVACKAHWPALAIGVLVCLGISGRVAVAGQSGELLFSINQKPIIIEADGTLEFTLSLRGIPKVPSSGIPDLNAWIVKADQPRPKGVSGMGIIQLWPSPLVEGEWLVHLRGLKPPKDDKSSKWDLLLHWQFGEAGGKGAKKIALEGEIRVSGAITFGVQESDVVLLLDGSTSMGRTDPKRLRVDAARAFVEMGRTSGGIGRIAIIEFSDKARVLLPLTPVTERAAFVTAIERLSENGMTDIDGSLRAALKILGVGSGSSRRAMVLLSDGKQEPGEYNQAHLLAKKSGIPVHTVALGKSSDQTLLKQIADETNGTFSEAHKGQDLLRLYAAIAGRIVGGRTILERATPEGQGKATFPVDGSCRSLAVSIENPGGRALGLKEPGGVLTQTGKQAQPVAFRRWPKPGSWEASWKTAKSGDSKDARLSARARTGLYPIFFRSNARLKSKFTSSKANPLLVELDVDDPQLAISLAEARFILPSAKVTVLFEVPGKKSVSVNLFDDGKHGDGLPNDGVYSAELFREIDKLVAAKTLAKGDANKEGTGRITAVVEGTRNGGERFRREVRARWVLRRSGNRRIQVTAPADWGSLYQGQTRRFAWDVRIRGAGGELTTQKESTSNGSALVNASELLTLHEWPRLISPRKAQRVHLEFSAPEGLPPGVYSGIVKLRLLGKQTPLGLVPEVTASIPWKIEVRAAQLRFSPEVLDLGQLAPGTVVARKLSISVVAGKAVVLPLGEMVGDRADRNLPQRTVRWARADKLLPDLDLAVRPAGAVRITKSGQAFQLTFRVSSDARAGTFHKELILRGAGLVEAARIKIVGEIQSAWLKDSTPIFLGLLEPGDSVNRAVRFKWQGMQAATSATLKWKSSIHFLHPEALAWWKPSLDENKRYGGELELKISDKAQSGKVEGWLQVEAGPSMMLRRWSAEIIRPHLSLDPPALNFGKVLQGNTRRLPIKVGFIGARSITLRSSLDGPPGKVLLPDRVLPEAALSIRPAMPILNPDGKADLTAELIIPDEAEPGHYQTKITLETRLGKRSLPVRLEVVSPVPLPIFHVAPTQMLLTVEEGTETGEGMLHIYSHQDQDCFVQVRLTPKTGNPPDGNICAELLRGDGSATDRLSFTLPARGRVQMQIQSKPDAKDWEQCSVWFEGGAERQEVRVYVERKGYLAKQPAKLGGDDQVSRFNWVTILFLIFLVLLILLVRALARQRWVRFATYALAFHAALMLMVVPPAEVAGSLPASIQVTLLETNSETGTELTPEQQRRLEEIKTITEDLAAAAEEEAKKIEMLEAMSQKKDLTPVELPPSPQDPGEQGKPAASAPLPENKMAASEKIGGAPSVKRLTKEVEAEQALVAEAEPPVRQEQPDEEVPKEEFLVPAPQPSKAAMAFTDSQELPLPMPAPAKRKETSLQDLTPATEASVALERQEVTSAMAEVPLTETQTMKHLSRPVQEAPGNEELPLMAEQVESASTELRASSNTETQDRMVTLAPSKPIAAPTNSVTRVSHPGLEVSRDTKGIVAKPSTLGTLSKVTSLGVEAAKRDHGTGSAPILKGGSLTRTAGTPDGEASEGALAAGSSKGIRSTVGQKSGTGQGSKNATNGIQVPTRAVGGKGFGSMTSELAGKGKGTWGSNELGSGSGHGRGLGPTEGKGLGKLEGLKVGKGGSEGTVAMSGGTKSRAQGLGGMGDSPLNLGAVRPGKGKGRGASHEGKGRGWKGGRGSPLGSGLGWSHKNASGGGKVFDEWMKGAGDKIAAKPLAGRALLDSGASAAMLERHDKGLKQKSGLGLSRFGSRPQWGPATGNILRVRIGLIRHKGDWNSSPTALYSLATAFQRRCGLPEVDIKLDKVSLTNRKKLGALNFVLITSNDPIPFTKSELAGLRWYLKQGGIVWVNDSSATGDERFDRGLKKDLAYLFPKNQLEVLRRSHAFFRSAYDLSAGYKGYKIPPGDKYREEFIQGLDLQQKGKGLRTGLFYTRNDYADGMEIDPSKISGRKSLTDLTAGEMLEGSLRVGLNMLAYALGSDAPRLPPPPDGSAEVAKLYRYKGRALPVLDGLQKLVTEDGDPIWRAEDWGNGTRISKIKSGRAHAIRVSFKGGTKVKAAVAREADVDLSKAKSVVFDLYSSLPHGMNISVLFQTRPDWEGFESRPLFIKPGWNLNLRIPLALGDFKSSKGGWKAYDSEFTGRAKTGRLVFLFYNHESTGHSLLRNLRVEK